ncbi:hypothetical protein C8R47DRAFT_1087806 [Mycena vitilis]|nr:hypothetical protein C8R47DRAFT_1087806 [Mycena vitilis]
MQSLCTRGKPSCYPQLPASEQTVLDDGPLADVAQPRDHGEVPRRACIHDAGMGRCGGWEPPEIQIDGTPFQALEEYIGTYKTLSTFLPQPTLTRVNILDASPHGLLTQLQAARSPVNVTAFMADFGEGIDTLTLGAIIGLLPSLTELRLCIVMEPDDDGEEDFPDGVNRYAANFFDALPNTPNLPSSLSQLALSWEFDFRDRAKTR